MSEHSTAGNPTAADRTALLLVADLGAFSVASEVLARCGLRTIRLSSVAELRKETSLHDASLLVCEEALPDGDFQDVLKFIRPSRADMPVIVFSRIADWDQYLTAVKLGACDSLQFPFRAGELQWAVAAALGTGHLALR
jgi:DNA-binding NtrC family response regulator